MKSVSWAFAFRKLKEWQGWEWISFGNVGEVTSQGETRQIYSGSTTRVDEVDEPNGTVTLFGEGTISLVGATFRFSDFTDSPFNEEDLGNEQFESQLEATFPDGTMLVFAREFKVGK